MSISLMTKPSSGGGNLDTVFALYVTGTSPAATGLLDDSGVDIATRYAPLIYGTQALPTDLFNTASEDINTLFAAYGTPSYTLALNGLTFEANEPIPKGESGSATCAFGFTSDTQFYVETYPSIGSPTYTYYSVPAGMTQVRLTLTFVGGATSPITSGNSAADYILLPTTQTQLAYIILGPKTSFGGAAEQLTTQWSLKVEFAPSDSVTTWSGTCTLIDVVSWTS